jgi:hypothetical protein
MRSIPAILAAVAIAALAVTLTWPGGPPLLFVDQFGAIDTVWDSASIIVVGVISSDIVVRRPASRSGRGASLQFRKMDMRIENVLKGSLNPRDLKKGVTSVYYYAFGADLMALNPWACGGSEVVVSSPCAATQGFSALLVIVGTAAR